MGGFTRTVFRFTGVSELGTGCIQMYPIRRAPFGGHLPPPPMVKALGFYVKLDVGIEFLGCFRMYLRNEGMWY